MRSRRCSLQPAGAGARQARSRSRSLQVRAILRGDGLFTRGQTRELQAEGGRASERKQQRQAAAGAGERGRGCRPPSADGEGALGEARAELPR